MSQKCPKMSQKKRFLARNRMWLMSSEAQELEILEESEPVRTGAIAADQSGTDFSARNETMNQRTDQPMNEPTNKPTKRIFGSMFAKASYSRCNERLPKELRQTGLLMAKQESSILSYSQTQGRAVTCREKTTCDSATESGH